MTRLDWDKAARHDRMHRSPTLSRPVREIVFRELHAKYPGRCEKCHGPIKPGDVIRKYLASYRHAVCPERAK